MWTTDLRSSALHKTLALALIIVGSASVMASQQMAYKGFVLNSPIGESTAVRFRYYSGGDFVQEPLIIRPVAPEDPRLNTALAAAEGWTTYVSFDEMRQLMQAIAQSTLGWKESKKVKLLEPYKMPLEVSDGVDIDVVSPVGTARARFDPTTICERLKPLDSAIKTRRALLEFQHFRSFIASCQIPRV